MSKRPTKAGESSSRIVEDEEDTEQVSKRARSDALGSSLKESADGGAREKSTSQSATDVKSMLTKAMLTLAERVSELEKGRRASDKGSGTPPDGMWEVARVA